MFDWITGWIDTLGYPAIAALMFLENLFPPIPSELVMPLSGYTASQGRLSLVGVLVAGWIGSMAGALFWYAIGRWLGYARIRAIAARHGAWLTMSPDDVDEANRWFCRHGGAAVFVGRLVPAVRTFISVPAGVSDMSFVTFLLYTSLGTAIWTAFLAGVGYGLGAEYGQVSQWLGPPTNAIIAVLVLWYGWRVVTFKRRQARAR